jgi:signal transduction histidine kinase
MEMRVVDNELMGDRHRGDPRDWVRLQYATVAVCTLVVVAYGATSFVPMPQSYHELLFAAIIVSLGGLMFGALNRQRRAVAGLHAREEQLAEQSALLQSTLENMGEGLSVFDRAGRLIAWNSRFAELLELTIDLTNQTLHDIRLYQARRGDFGAVDPVEETRRRVEGFHRNLPRSIERTTANGRTLQIRRREMPDGAVVSLYSDITERKAAEEKMEQARAQAEFLNRAKSDFLANMSHELRTPLNAIIGFSEVLATEILGPLAQDKQLEYIKDIHSSGLLLLSIINDVLDMSKIEAGKVELALERVSVQRVIKEAARMVDEQVRSRKLDVVLKVPEEEILVWGDERAIKQVMLNLLSNAVKFSHDGGRIDIRAALEGAGGLVFEVADQGIGMAEAEIERALQPFGQAKSATTKTHGGTGLGLPIAKGMVEAHGGTLVVESTAGRGTVVRIMLPPRSQMPDVILDLLRDIAAPSGTGRAVAQGQPSLSQ